MPSPTIADPFAGRLQLLDLRGLVIRPAPRPARGRSPTCAAMACAVSSVSPVSMTTFRPERVQLGRSPRPNRASACRRPRSSPAGRVLAATTITVLPCRLKPVDFGLAQRREAIPSSPLDPARACPRHRRPSTRAWTPRPPAAWNSSRIGTARALVSAAVRDDRLAQRVLGAALGRGRQLQQLVCRPADAARRGAAPSR